MKRRKIKRRNAPNTIAVWRIHTVRNNDDTYFVSVLRGGFPVACETHNVRSIALYRALAATKRLRRGRLVDGRRMIELCWSDWTRRKAPPAWGSL